MIAISYEAMLVLISAVWCVNRAIIWVKNKRLDLKRELQLLLVYICIVVIVRFTFCPFGKVDGRIQPLIFDVERLFPFRINLIPFVHLFDYQIKSEAVLNLVGNILMFTPVGIVFSVVYKKLDTHIKVIATGIGFSLFIELLQLPFYDRVSDIDDLILNSSGYILGYLIYSGVKSIKNKLSCEKSSLSN
ncbi:MAG: VanZ family protein [Acutalibacteraceae bacterium]|nr:VanZ family protein [Acutalibacteraceae bacterium]